MSAAVEAAILREPPPSDAPAKASRSATWMWIGRKFAGSAATLVFICVLNFFLFRVINPHPERVVARGRATTPEQVAELRHKLGLDQPLPQQFLTYLKNLVTLQFGDSTQYSQPVRTLILNHLWPTVALVGTSAILSIIFGLWIGTVAAWNRGHKFDGISTTTTITLYSMPEW
ncbi:MAG TPA: ABC transporter permease, partial [Nocardioidaceae bacterium]|nr:ABC transporter permease [Nocardioidaceae bacterium]